MQRLQVAVRKPVKGTIDLEEASLSWDTRLHMSVLQVFDEWKQFASRISYHRPRPVEARDPQARKLPWIVSLKGKSTICATLSPRHIVELNTGDIHTS